MRIAHFYDGIYLNGGVSSYITSLSELQVQDGHEIFLFEETKTTGPRGSAGATVVTNNDDLFRACLERRIDILHMHAGLTKAPPETLNVVFTVHEHQPHCLSGGLFLKRRNEPCPRTYNLLGCISGHLVDHCGSLRPARFLRNISKTQQLKKLLPDVTVISVGEFLRNRMIHAGYKPESVNFVPNFTTFPDISDGKLGDEVGHFVYLGRLEPNKGVSWLLKSFAKMSNESNLIIAGSGTQEPYLKSLSIKLGVEKRVKFLGWVAKEQKTQLLRDARALVVPSIWHETFGLVVIEAAAQGCPVIASNAGELPFLVDHEQTGLIVPVGNISALSRSLDFLADNRGKALSMGTANRKMCELRFNSASHMVKLNEIYRICIKSKVEKDSKI